MRLLYPRGPGGGSLSSRHGRRLALVGSAMAVLGAVSLVAGCVAAPAMQSAGPPNAARPSGSGYWHTEGNRIYDSQGHPIRIPGINSYRFQPPDHLPTALWTPPH